MLSEILSKIDCEIRGTLPKEINGIQSDSRQVKSGNLFVAICGMVTDGHNYLLQSQESGASVALVEKYSDEIQIPQIKVKNSKKVLLELVDNFYENPTDDMTVIGITGTNGKTTTTYLIDQIYTHIGYKSGYIGTYGYGILGKKYDTNLTTPDIVQLYEIFHQMKEAGVEYVIMEVSSHAIALERVTKIKFDAAVFTNISRDHLDFHKTIENYAETKAKLFAMIPKSGFTVINLDDEFSQLFRDKSKTNVITYAINNEDADIHFSDNTTFGEGVNGHIVVGNKTYEIHSQLSGQFNMRNLAATIAVCRRFNLPMVYILNALRKIAPPPGRLEEIKSENFPRVFVDYAHTPDAITNALKALKEILPQNGRLISIFGCGGNRDKTKRPLMAKASEEIADFSILTTDNPRFEEPEIIIKDAEMGFEKPNNYKIIIDRKKAIEYGIQNHTNKDIIAILGKGHENYQDIKGVKHHFDDCEIVREYFNENK